MAGYGLEPPFFQGQRRLFLAFPKTRRIWREGIRISSHSKQGKAEQATELVRGGVTEPPISAQIRAANPPKGSRN